MSSVDQDRDAILVVDDESAVLRSIRRTLRTQGYEQIRLCNDSRQALDLLRQEGAGVVLLDLIMPFLDGEQVMAQIREFDPRIPVVVITAEQDARTAVRCLKKGAYDYLVKPVTAEDLAAVVARALEHARPRLENEKLRRLVDALRDPDSGRDPIPDEAWKELQRANFKAALRRSRGQISGAGGAAEKLGLKASTLESRLKALGVDRHEFRGDQE